MVSKSQASRARAYMRTHGVTYQQALALVSTPRTLSREPRWLRALGIDNLDTYDPNILWERSIRNDSLRAPVGFRLSPAAQLQYLDSEAVTEELFTVDVAAERHGLILGQTGSGKTYACRSFLGGIAAWHSPAKVQFVLLDFEGAQTFGRFTAMPHAAGVYTDPTILKIADVALAAIDEEFERRATLFRDHNVADFGHYQRVQRMQDIAPKLSTLIIVTPAFDYCLDCVPAFHDTMSQLFTEGPELGMHLVIESYDYTNILREFGDHISFSISIHTTSPEASTLAVGDDSACFLAAGTGHALARTSQAGEGAHPLQIFDVRESRPNGTRAWDALITRFSQHGSRPIHVGLDEIFGPVNDRNDQLLSEYPIHQSLFY